MQVQLSRAARATAAPATSPSHPPSACETGRGAIGSSRPPWPHGPGLTRGHSRVPSRARRGSAQAGPGPGRGSAGRLRAGASLPARPGAGHTGWARPPPGPQRTALLREPRLLGPERQALCRPPAPPLVPLRPHIGPSAPGPGRAPPAQPRTSAPRCFLLTPHIAAGARASQLRAHGQMCRRSRLSRVATPPLSKFPADASRGAQAERDSQFSAGTQGAAGKAARVTCQGPGDPPPVSV